jgi:hypothetical protein
MVTHYPRHAASRPVAVAETPRASEGVGARVLEWIRQTYCGLHGHDTMLHFEKDRLFLQCVSCGHKTPGWDLNETRRPPVPVHAEATQRTVMHPHLVGARRIA